MPFRISGLPAEPFRHLFALGDDELKRQGAVRRIAADGGYPCRVSLTDAKAGDEVILVNYEHQDADTPYRSRHAIYVRAGEERYEATGEVPEQLRKRLLSVRAFDAAGMMLDADVTEGRALEALVDRFFANRDVAYLHLHYARPGCYAARVDRT
jgi:Protein of unknown function (DUF1203)